jgi:hypothetical protein
MDVKQDFADFINADGAIHNIVADRVTTGALTGIQLPAIQICDTSLDLDSPNRYLQINAWLDGTEPAAVVALANELAGLLRKRVASGLTGYNVRIIRDQIHGDRATAGPEYDRRRVSMDLHVVRITTVEA